MLSLSLSLSLNTRIHIEHIVTACCTLSFPLHVTLHGMQTGHMQLSHCRHNILTYTVLAGAPTVPMANEARSRVTYLNTDLLCCSLAFPSWALLTRRTDQDFTTPR